MSETEATTEAPAAAPVKRRSTSVKAKTQGKAEGAATPGRNSSATRTPRKSVKAGGAQQQQPQGGSNNRRQNASNAGKQNNGGSNRQKQGGGQNRQNNSQNQRRQRRQHDNNRGNREVQPSVSREELAKLKVAELREKAAELNLDVTGLKKAELVEAVFEASVKAEGFIEVSGILDILADGYGFLRTQGYLPSETDCYVGLSTIRRNGLRKGDLVSGQTRPARENEKYAAIQKVTAVNGTPVEELGSRVRFGDLTPVYPDECLVMEHGKNTVTARVIDLVSLINREVQPSVSREELAKLKVAELREKAAELNLDVTGLKKAELVEAVFEASVKAEGFIEVSGILDILADGYGFLRTQGYLPSETDCYVGLSTIRRNGLRKGDLVSGQTRPARENEKYAAIQKVTAVNGTPVEELGSRVRFGDLTPVYPDECLVMEHGKNTVTARVIDLVSPIGKGQRGLIVSPPKAGKTTILKDIAAAISANNPEVHLMCLLVDERPEEVTDMERSIKGEVLSLIHI